MTTIAATLPEGVQLPQYDRSQLRSRIVHFGFGAFHRAQALLTDRVLNAGGGDWGFVNQSVQRRSADEPASPAEPPVSVLEKAPRAISQSWSAPSTECLNANWIRWPRLFEILRTTGRHRPL